MKVMMASGGTGGHVFPALAVARELRRRDPACELLFVGTEKGIEARAVPEAGFALRTVAAAGLKGVSGEAKLRSLALLPSNLLANQRLLRAFDPDVVFGTGAYVAGPTLLMAALTRRPTVLFEPNAEPGLANRLLAPLVTRAAVTFEETLRCFGSSAVRTGSPIREEFLAVAPRRHQPPYTLMIFGGSRGAVGLNRAILDALDPLSSGRHRLRFIHQTGERDFDAVRAAYASRNICAEVKPFFNDMAARFAEADLIICRSGASTVAELAAAGRAAVLVPFPHATDQHQLRNAEVFARAGAARLIEQDELTGPRLAAEISGLLERSEQLTEMETAARRLAVPDATGRIADLLESVAR